MIHVANVGFSNEAVRSSAGKLPAILQEMYILRVDDVNREVHDLNLPDCNHSLQDGELKLSSMVLCATADRDFKRLRGALRSVQVGHRD